MYLHNNNGKTPCTDCPRNTYWVDGNDRARCDPCPAGRRTNGRGARKLEDCLGQLNKYMFDKIKRDGSSIILKHYLNSVSNFSLLAFVKKQITGFML